MKVPLSVVAVGLSLGAMARAADFTVTNTNSFGPGSLSQAITDANNLPGADRVLFNIPGPNVHIIDLSQTALPAISESLVIDGYSQPGAKPNSLAVGNNAVILIQLDGGATAGNPSSGLLLGPFANTSDFMIRGLSLTGFVRATQNGAATGGTAIEIGSVKSAVISGNFIGLLPDGESARGNDRGIVVRENDQGYSSDFRTRVGGNDPASRNVISGNTSRGLVASGLISGNYFGTNASGTKAVPNEVAISLVGERSDTLIGGTTTNDANLISGNRYGIYFGEVTVYQSLVIHTPGSYARIQGNVIGLQADRSSALPNRYPIKLETGSNNIIGGLDPGAGNIIAFNDSGVDIAVKPVRSRFNIYVASAGNQILSNAIYGNAGCGIDLGTDGPTPNDPGDADTGPNTFQNSPVITSTEIANGSATIKGTLNSTAHTQFTLQFFSEALDVGQPLQTYLGGTSVTTGSDGNATFSATFPISDTALSFNMTATNQNGNTSEFSRNAGRLLNISTRGRASDNETTLIGGFIVRGSNYVVVRALGPSLPFATGSLPDPFLQIFDSAGKLIAENDNWRESAGHETISEKGLAPSNDLEAARAIVLSDGAYTVVVRDTNGSSGLALVEVFNLTTEAGELANVSTRGLVQPGDGALIGGFIVEATHGTSRVILRALGPSLGAAGIEQPVADPTLELHDSQGTTVASNDNWPEHQQADGLSAVGLAPPNASEAAIFTRLGAGAYTAIVRAKDGMPGVAVVEAYNLR